MKTKEYIREAKPTATPQPQDTHEIYQRNQALISRLTGVSEEDMYWGIIDAGCDYLEHQAMGDIAATQEIRYMHFYWAWWFEQWYQRDAEFIAYHDLSRASRDARPSRNVLNAYTYYHSKGIRRESLCKSYMHLMTTTQKIWRTKL